MANLVTVLPDLDLQPFTHLLPSLEKAAISTADLLTIDALDIAKRAQVPSGEVKKLHEAVLKGLRHDLQADSATVTSVSPSSAFITTLDAGLDAALGGGICAGQLTEIVGESAVGKTQFLLTLLLSVQLPPPHGLDRSALYISTEAPLQTTRLAQILKTHPRLGSTSTPPSLSRIHSTHIHDVEAQEHILRYQVPVAIQKQNVGLLIIDSVAANYRAEFDKAKSNKGAESFAKRSNQITQLGKLLHDIARKFDVAVVVANQVADRFTTLSASSQTVHLSQATHRSRPDSPHPAGANVYTLMSQDTPLPLPTTSSTLSTDDPLALDHQQCFFTGWGDDTSASHLKTPSLGFAWTNQLATRVALLKQPVYDDKAYEPGEDRTLIGWNRTAKVVFSAWGAESSTAFQIWEGGIRSVQDPET